MVEKKMQEKITDELKIKDRPTKHYAERELGQIIDLLVQEIEDIKNRLTKLEKI